jgi:ketosteroid isomerase-like protein
MLVMTPPVLSCCGARIDRASIGVHTLRQFPVTLRPLAALPTTHEDQEAAMTNAGLTSDIEAFFEAYNEAFASFDGHRIAALYHLPTVTMRGDGSIHCLRSREELARFFQGVADTYRKDGYAGSRFEGLQVSPIGGRSALATLDWKMSRGDGSLIREWRQSYNLVRVVSGWEILVSTFHLPGATPAA